MRKDQNLQNVNGMNYFRIKIVMFIFDRKDKK